MASEPQSFCPLPHPTRRHLEDVQKGRSILLDCRGDPSLCRYHRRKRLSPTEQHFISHVLAFFAASDGIINDNLSSNFATEVTLPEAQCFYGFQIAVKNIHNITYSLLIDTYIKDSTKKMHLLRAIETVPCIQRKAQRALKWCNTTTATASFVAKCTIAFAAVEGIFFSGSFCAIFSTKAITTATAGTATPAPAQGCGTATAT